MTLARKLHARKKTMEQFIGTIETQEPITKFDEGLWSGLADFVTVYSTKDIRVTFIWILNMCNGFMI